MRKSIMSAIRFDVRKWVSGILFAVLGGAAVLAHAQPVSTNIFGKALSLEDALDMAMTRNTAILQAKADMRVNEGLVVQTRSIALPKLTASGNYTDQSRGSIQQFPIQSASMEQPSQNWSSSFRVQQSIYEGGRLTAALRAVKLTREASRLNYETTVADTLLSVRVAYADALLAGQQIAVQEASVKLLSRELDDMNKRFDAGTAPHFNVLRAKVELANAQPRLIRARNASRIAKNNLSNLLGANLPREVWEDIPMELSGKLQAVPFETPLPEAIGKALDKRSELAALRKLLSLRKEDIINAKSGYKPGVQVFAGYQWRSPTFGKDLSKEYDGWLAGGQMTWSIFDGAMTRGKIMEAEAREDRARLDVDDAVRRIEFQVRTAYSDFVEAREVMESQRQVQEQAEEALRLAEARLDAGTGTQLDALGAQTALTEARTTQIQALHDYEVAMAKLNWAMGLAIR
jgi:outer membrane protein TolC